MNKDLDELVRLIIKENKTEEQYKEIGILRIKLNEQLDDYDKFIVQEYSNGEYCGTMIEIMKQKNNNQEQQIKQLKSQNEKLQKVIDEIVKWIDELKDYETKRINNLFTPNEGFLIETINKILSNLEVEK